MDGTRPLAFAGLFNQCLFALGINLKLSPPCHNACQVCREISMRLPNGQIACRGNITHSLLIEETAIESH